MKQSTSFDQNKLKVVCDNLCDKIENLLDYLNLEYKINNKFISMRCPIHNGDNSSAINIYYNGDNYRGNWVCRTHGCEKIFKASIIGFLRGVISNKNYNWSKVGDKTISFDDTIKFCLDFLNMSLKDIHISKIEKEKNNFINSTKIFSDNDSIKYNLPPRSSVIKNLKIPSQYFINRGFSKEILIKYDIGDCQSKDKEMSDRAVVPIYDDGHNFMIGCSGRTIFNKCKSCDCYHNGECPASEQSYKYSKWKHSSGFKTQQCLYNFWFAKDHILSSNKAIIVESPGNVWKLEENNIHNSIAIFGTNLADRQKMILDTSGAMELIIIMDNDDAGKKARDQIYDKCHRTYNIKNIFISKNDIADMTPDEIQSEIKDKL